MAFHPLFLDSFDHYTDLSQKWAIVPASCAINTAGNARTGLGCLICTQESLVDSGPTSPNLGQQPNLILGHGFCPLQGQQHTVINFLDQTGNDPQCFAQFNADGSLSIIAHYSGSPGALLGQSPPGLILQGVYNYIEYAIIFAEGTGGSVFVRINGQLVISSVGVGTASSGNNWCTAVQPSGPPQGADSAAYHDDFYVGYSDLANIQDDFQGALRLYPYIPAVDETPVQWTPLNGQNWQETSQIPPPGDAAYVAGPSVGLVDQYQMQPISGEGPTGAFTIPFGQAVICAKLDSAGSAEVAPDIAGTVGASVALTTTYHMLTQPYTTNPATGAPFVPGDFNTTFMGPKVTA